MDAREKYPTEFMQWREDPSNFCIDGVYPTRKLWETAREAWLEILFRPVYIWPFFGLSSHYFTVCYWMIIN